MRFVLPPLLALAAIPAIAQEVGNNCVPISTVAEFCPMATVTRVESFDETTLLRVYLPNLSGTSEFMVSVRLVGQTFAERGEFLAEMARNQEAFSIVGASASLIEPGVGEVNGMFATWQIFDHPLGEGVGSLRSVELWMEMGDRALEISAVLLPQPHHSSALLASPLLVAQMIHPAEDDTFTEDGK